MKPAAVDPRAWNIIAGLCVASGCGGRTLSSDASGTDTSESSHSSTESNSTIGTLDTGAPECVADGDCPTGYYCYDGECEYVPHQDGHIEEGNWSPDCYTDSECSQLSICVSGLCHQLGAPPECPAPDPVEDLPIPLAALALQFVDVDADGADEMVVATQSELQVYESGEDLPQVSPRGFDSDSIDAMVGGPFDAIAGDDVVILFADELRLHGSDGAGGFAVPSMSPSDYPDSVGLLGGELDGVPPADVLIWASSGAGVALGSGAVVPLSVEMIGSASARWLADPLGGIVLQHGNVLDFYTTAGLVNGSVEMRGDAPYALTSITHLGQSFDLSSSVIPHRQSWTLIEHWVPPTGNFGTQWGLRGQVTAMASGDFDGDTQADVAFIVDAAVQIQFAVLTDATCLALYSFPITPRNLAVGDHDGDGDDELGVRFQAGNIEILDGE